MIYERRHPTNSQGTATTEHSAVWLSRLEKRAAPTALIGIVRSVDLVFEAVDKEGILLGFVGVHHLCHRHDPHAVPLKREKKNPQALKIMRVKSDAN